MTPDITKRTKGLTEISLSISKIQLKVSTKRKPNVQVTVVMEEHKTNPKSN